MADLSGDTALEEAFTSGHDFHAETASRVFRVPPGEVTVEMRSRIKAMNYGLAYGLSAYGLSQQLRITPDEARALMDEYFQQFGGIRDYLYAVVDQARKDGYTADRPRPPALPARPDLRQPAAPGDGRADGAQRPDPGLGRRHHQGGHAPGRTQALREEGLRSRMLLQVHDELVFEVAPGELDTLRELVPRTMCGSLRPAGAARGVARHRPDGLAGH